MYMRMLGSTVDSMADAASGAKGLVKYAQVLPGLECFYFYINVCFLYCLRISSIDILTWEQ